MFDLLPPCRHRPLFKHGRVLVTFVYVLLFYSCILHFVLIVAVLFSLPIFLLVASVFVFSLFSIVLFLVSGCGGVVLFISLSSSCASLPLVSQGFLPSRGSLLSVGRFGHSEQVWVVLLLQYSSENFCLTGERIDRVVVMDI